MTTNSTYIYEESRKKHFQKKLDLLKSAIESDEDPDYMTVGLYNLYSRLIENDQYSDIEVDKPVIVDKLIRCYRFIPNAYLDFFFTDYVVMGGLFLTTKICIMPTSMINECMKSNRLGAIYHPEEYGLPSGIEVDYGTTRIVNEKITTALARGSWINDWIDHYYQYEYVTLGMN